LVHPDGSGLQALFPCKPAGHVRRLLLAGAAIEMSLFACSAGGETFAVGFADVHDPQRVAQALDELSAASVRNVLAAQTSAAAPVQVAGMTPNPRATKQAILGQSGDGRRLEMHAAVFARGTTVFQATVVGQAVDALVLDQFFTALRFPT
jgi:hypothetical protein